MSEARAPHLDALPNYENAIILKDKLFSYIVKSNRQPEE